MHTGSPTSLQSALDARQKTLQQETRLRPPHEAASLLSAHPAVEAAAVLMELNPGFAQDILAEFAAGFRHEVIRAAPPEIARQWERNQTYAEGSVGRLMEPMYAVFHPETTVGEAIEQLRALVKTRFITYGYVTDPGGKLVGVITMRDLLFADHVRGAESRDHGTGRQHGRRRKGGAPGHTVETEPQVPSSMAAAEPLHGLHRRRSRRLFSGHCGPPGDTRAVSAGARRAVRQHRLPGAGGDAARALTLGELKPGKEKLLVVKEALLGLLNGALVGLVAAVGMYIVAAYQHTPNALLLAVVVWLAMIGSCVASGVSGAMVPLTLKRFGADPATASSIFLTTATDVVSMGLLLGLATLLIR